MIEDRVTISRRSAWTKGNFPADNLRVEIWDGTGTTEAYRLNGHWCDAATGKRMSDDLDRWHPIWTGAI